MRVVASGRRGRQGAQRIKPNRWHFPFFVFASSTQGLAHIQNDLVGSPEKRGVSGGQKKRVNIGMELVASCGFCGRKGGGVPWRAFESKTTRNDDNVKNGHTTCFVSK